MLQMVKEVLANLSILISSAYLLSKISKTLLTHQSPLIHKLVMGLGSGITGIILMNFSISYQDSFLIDIRLVPLVMASFSYGGITPLIAGVIIGISRLFYGLSPPIIGICLTYCLIGLSQYFISSWVQDKKVYLRLTFIFTSSIVLVILNFLIHSPYQNNTPIILVFIIYNLLGMLISYQFSKDIETEKEAFLHYESVSKYDYLTSVFNRYSFDKDLTALFKQEKLVTIFLLDINNFKHFNDTYGHDIGDLILKKVSSSLLNASFPQHKVYRIGGDEFVLVIPSALSNKAIIETKAKIKQQINQLTIQLDNQFVLRISTSIGSSSSKPSQTIDELYRQADIELYIDKKSKSTSS
ncbi:GGDEF domain-containing protein [Carnobacterium maltaromaticum]|uniref:GGDEF domain-containing protein n=1 Tax=Carnobacterium maltaromaticum TaxID=2751 RepID=UPI0039AFB588